jgi:hypothetical protein
METVLKHRFEQAINHYEVRPGFGFASNPLGDREGGMWLRECDELPIIVVVFLKCEALDSKMRVLFSRTSPAEEMRAERLM